jgi:dipeptidyl aminopeptidase/acylaminoacyl peptidase
VSRNESAAEQLIRSTRAEFFLDSSFWSILMNGIALLVGLAAQSHAAGDELKAKENRAVTVEDAIEMTRLADPGYLGGGASAGRVAIFSPDRSRFAVVLRKGHISTNSNEYSLILWQTREVFGSAEHEVVLKLESSSNRPGIESVRWLKDNETIMLLGENPGEAHQVYRFNCRTRELTRVTNSPTNVISYGLGTGNTIAYTAETAGHPSEPSWQRFGRPISTQLVTDVLLGHPDEQWSDHVRVVLQPDAPRQPAFELARDFLMPFPSSDDAPVVSPNGRYVLLLANSERIPGSWRDYSDTLMQKWARWNVDSGQYSMLRCWTLFDTEMHSVTPLIDAPIALTGLGSEAAWLPDSRSVVITNSYLPLDNVSTEEREARRKGPVVAEIHVPSGKITKVTSKNLKLLRWDANANELVFSQEESTQNGGAPAEVRFQNRTGRWEEAVVRDRREPGTPEIALDEGLNLSPRIVATAAGHEKRVLLDLNPQFQGIKFGTEEQIRWKARDGHVVEGGLYYPVDFVPGRRYPLVIQTHGFQPNRFQIDGPYSSVFAAQPLAAKGIMVLQAEKPERSEVIGHLATGAEAQWRVSAYEGAVDYLDGRGLIDRSRVGIMGFSRTCWYVKYALTHSSFPFAAVAVSDGIDMGYFIYAAMANRGYPDNEMDQIMSAIPSGKGVDVWSREAPGFQVNKMSDQVPVRIVAAYPLDVLVEWEWFAMMKRLRKPVDMVAFLDGVHVLEKPLNRLVSQGGNVDWFDFWLNGREDPDPAKTEQYERWRKLKKQIGAGLPPDK